MDELQSLESQPQLFYEIETEKLTTTSLTTKTIVLDSVDLLQMIQSLKDSIFQSETKISLLEQRLTTLEWK